MEGLFERRLKGRDIVSLQETIEEIGFRGDQDDEEDVFAIAEDNRRKRREAAEDAEAVEEDQDHEGGVVGDDGPGAAELSLILHVEPSAEQHNSRHAVHGCLHQQEHQVQACEGVPLCPVPVSTQKH